MTNTEIISRLKELVEDRKSLMSKDGDNSIYELDIQALEEAIDKIKIFNKCKSSNFIQREDVI